MQPNKSRIYSSKILKAGALLSDTKALLVNWDSTQTPSENLDRFRKENIFGKASRSRVEDILKIFRQRYLNEECVTKALIELVNGNVSAESLDRILYFHSARSDPLLHDLVTELIFPMYKDGLQNIYLEDVEVWIRKKIAEGKTRSSWSESTIKKSASGLMSTLRDFGILQGVRNKRVAPTYLSTEAFSYIAFYLSKMQPSGKRLIEDPEWQLFFLSPQAVEHFFMEAHQLHILNYQAAGSVIVITFPAESLEEYAHVIVERSH